MSNEFRYYSPTPHLRWATVMTPVGRDDGQVVRVERVLQQLWTSVAIGEPDVWREIPTAEADE